MEFTAYEGNVQRELRKIRNKLLSLPDEIKNGQKWHELILTHFGLMVFFRPSEKGFLMISGVEK